MGRVVKGPKKAKDKEDAKNEAKKDMKKEASRAIDWIQNAAESSRD